MDNGLIFPYPYGTARAESRDAKVPGDAFGLIPVPDLAGSRQAGGVTQEASSTGRWLSRGKGVGRRAGKSARQVPET
jgi:hypothetical protein